MTTNKTEKPLFGCMKGSVHILGDIVESVWLEEAKARLDNYHKGQSDVVAFEEIFGDDTERPLKV